MFNNVTVTDGKTDGQTPHDKKVALALHGKSHMTVR